MTTMASKHEAVSPPANPPIADDTVIKVIDHLAYVEVQLWTRWEQWVTLYERGRDAVIEAVTAEAREARRLEAKHRARAQAFEWAAKFIADRNHADPE